MSEDLTRTKKCSITVQRGIWAQAQHKAGLNAQSLSGVIQRLLELWLAGRVNLEEGPQ